MDGHGIDIYVENPESSNTRTFLIFKDYRSLMDSWEKNEDGNSLFRNIPLGARVTLFSIAKKGEDFYLAIQEKKMDLNGELIHLEFKKSSPEKIRKRLKKLERNI